jgi:AcrR family transcriptional regulator
MTKPVKRRAYESAVRQGQAAQTRSKILAAAGLLFEADGYGRTTIKAIAEAAGVATDTVYAVFGTKARVLTALIDQRLAPAGDDNVTQRSQAQAVRDEPDQRRQIQLFAHDIAGLSSRVRPVYEIMRTASAVEPDMAAVFAEMEGYRANNMHRVAEWLAANGPLRVDVERAAEIIWVLTSPDVARQLCDIRGWSDDEFASWLEDTLLRVLLPDAGT